MIAATTLCVWSTTKWFITLNVLICWAAMWNFVVECACRNAPERACIFLEFIPAFQPYKKICNFFDHFDGLLQMYDDDEEEEEKNDNQFSNGVFLCSALNPLEINRYCCGFRQIEQTMMMDLFIVNLCKLCLNKTSTLRYESITLKLWRK